MATKYRGHNFLFASLIGDFLFGTSWITVVVTKLFLHLPCSLARCRIFRPRPLRIFRGSDAYEDQQCIHKSMLQPIIQLHLLAKVRSRCFSLLLHYFLKLFAVFAKLVSFLADIFCFLSVYERSKAAHTFLPLVLTCFALFLPVITTDNTNLLIRYISRQSEDKVRTARFFFCAIILMTFVFSPRAR